MKQFCRRDGAAHRRWLYRVWKALPPFLFYAHEDYADMAVRIVSPTACFKSIGDSLC